jgi:hypothetical protein
MAYDPNATDNLNLVRRMIGDTSSAPLLTDATVNYFIAQQQVPDTSTQTDLLDVAVQCLEMMAAAYATLADKSIGDLSIRYSQLFSNAKEMIDRYKAEISDRAERLARKSPGTVFSGTAELDTLVDPGFLDAAGRPSGLSMTNSRPPGPTTW